MLHIKCHGNVDRVIPAVLCVASVTDSPVLIACTLVSRSVSYHDWIVTNVECMLLTMRICDAWLLLQLVMERWVPRSSKYGLSLRSTSLDTVRHVQHSLVNYIGLNIDDSNVWFQSLWWDCIPAFYLYNRQRDNNMGMTCMVFCKWGHI